MGQRPEFAAARPASWVNHATYLAFRYSFGLLFRLAFRLRTRGQQPPAGGAVIVANHSSFLDPILLGLAVQPRVTFMMSEVVYRSPWLRWFYRLNRVIPLAVDGGNRDAMRAAREVLRRGECLCIFPEGGISRDGELMLGNPGAVSLVLSESLPIVPVGIRGAFAAMPNHRGPRLSPIEVILGEPIEHEELDRLGDGNRKRRLQLATGRIMSAIAAELGAQSRESVLADS